MKHFIVTLTILLSGVFITPQVWASPGGLDKNGCHTCHTNCAQYGLSAEEYHCHAGNGEVKRRVPTPKNKEDMKLVNPTKSPTRKPTSKPKQIISISKKISPTKKVLKPTGKKKPTPTHKVTKKPTTKPKITKKVAKRVPTKKPTAAKKKR